MKKILLLRFIPLLTLIAIGLGLYFLGYLDFLNISYIKEQHLHIKQAVTKSPIPSTLLFIGIYIVVAALSLPGASFVTVIGGFIFPQPLSTLYVVTGATVGASLLFLACKTAFKKPIERYLKRHAKGKLSELQKGFKQSASSYMLFVRFVPLFPFWLVNLAAAFLGASFKAFVWTTFIGVIPGSFVYTQLGKGLSVSFSQNKLSLASAFNFDMTIAIVLLALFSLLPIAIRHFRKKKQR